MVVQRRNSTSSSWSGKTDRSMRLADNSNDLADCSMGSNVTVKEERAAQLAAAFEQYKINETLLLDGAANTQAPLQQLHPVAGVTQPTALPPHALMPPGQHLPCLFPSGIYMPVPTAGPMGQMTSPCVGQAAMPCTNQAPGASGSSGQCRSTTDSQGKVRRTVDKNRNTTTWNSTTQPSPPRAPVIVTDEDWENRLKKRLHSIMKLKSSPIYYTYEDHPYARENWPAEPNPRDQTLGKRPWEKKVAEWRGSWRRINAVCQLMAKGYAQMVCEIAWSRVEDAETQKGESEEHGAHQERKHNERVAQAKKLLSSC